MNKLNEIKDNYEVLEESELLKLILEKTEIAFGEMKIISKVIDIKK